MSVSRAQLRLMLTQCGRDLERVVVDGDGEWTVYNNREAAERVLRRRDASAPPPRRTVTQPVTQAPSPARPPRPRRAVTAAPTPRPVALQRPPAGARFTTYTGAAPYRDAPSVRAGVPGEDFDWSSVPVEATATQLRARFERGLPLPMTFEYHADVLALQSVDIDSADAAVRAPQRVEIRPETKNKGYPVLLFARGDCQVIMGFRNPFRPVCIAAYWTAMLVHDTDRPGYAAGMAGGTRREKGHTSPGTVPKLISALRARGAAVDWDLLRTLPAPVTYRGNDLGKVPVDKQTRKDVQFTWSRLLNKMAAVDRRLDE